MAHNKAVCAGGWPFSTADHGWPIADCTSEGLKVALGARSLDYITHLPDDRVFDAVNIVLSFQNEDGGWATYENTRGWNWFEYLNPAEVWPALRHPLLLGWPLTACPSQVFGDIMIDYSYVELSSACVTALAKFRKEYPTHRRAEVDRAIVRGSKFIGAVQRADGSWYGSWAVCFTYGTWFGVEGLLASGVKPSDERIVRCVVWVAIQTLACRRLTLLDVVAVVLLLPRAVRTSSC